MKKSLKIGSAAGIGIYLHWSFLILLIGLGGYYVWQTGSVAAAAQGIGLILAVFGCVILHELGHALTARRFEVPTRNITLYPIGGVAQLERIPEEPMYEFWIAIAGPAVNIVIAAVLAVGLLIAGAPLMPTITGPVPPIASALLWMNIVLAGFNLLPAFPMDGGRVLRSLLALKKDYAEATQIASNVGQGMAILFGLFGLINFNPILLFIAFFVYVGAQQEAQQAMFRTLTDGTPVRRAMMTRFATLRPDATLGDAVDELLAGADHDFPIVDDAGRVVGILQRKKLIEALNTHDREAPVRTVMDDECLTVTPQDMLNEAFQHMQQADCSTVPVVDGSGELVGLLTLENVGELMMVSSAEGTRDAQALRSAAQQALDDDAPAVPQK
ncbi:site-2 protease family protein [Salisaeta longa]|uniref:site-2 protease family protein n=1 Tax=Salisaeta longa TaxID=503170 RepID=UPI0003B5CC8E|nr:site-2 protease family protein [Salisaeta longa]